MKKGFFTLSFTLLCSTLFAAFPISNEVVAVAEQTNRNFHFGGFLLGLLLGVTGVLICYLIDKKDMIRSAWYGFGAYVALIISVLVIFFIGYSNNDSNRPYF